MTAAGSDQSGAPEEPAGGPPGPGQGPGPVVQAGAGPGARGQGQGHPGAAGPPGDEPGDLVVSRVRRLRWWREVLYVLAFYWVYSVIRNQGVATESAGRAFGHARDVIRLERLVGLYFEESVQDAFLPHDWFIRFWNIFYGSAHFLVTAGVLVWLFRRMPARYHRWRNTLAATTGLALFGYAFYPLMPPRLLPDAYGYVDTLATVGGLWSFDSGTVAKLSNQYAAMPSLHFGWSTWCALVLLPAMRRPWARVLVVAYPFLTLFAIVVTANHYWLDAAGGAVVLGAGAAVARADPAGRLRARRRRAGRRDREEAVDLTGGTEDTDAGVAAGAGCGVAP